MVKKRILSATFTAFVVMLVAAGPGVTNYSVACAEEKTGGFLSVVSDETAFEYDADNPTKLTGFTLPAGVEGYFEVVIPDTVTVIDKGAFTGTNDDPVLSNYFISVEIPASVTAIHQGAFVNCNNLLEVCLPNASLAGDAEGSGLLDGSLSVVIGAENKTLHTASDENGNYLFVRNGGAESKEWTLVTYEGEATALTLPAPSVCDASCTSYEIFHDAFHGARITSLMIPEGVSSVGQRAFESCNRLTSVAFGRDLTSIGAYAFVNTALTSLTVPRGVAQIGDHAFNGCMFLTSIVFEEREAKLNLGLFAFANCTALKTVSLPDHAELLQNAFSGCTSLQWAYVGADNAFNNTGEGKDDGKATFFPTGTALTIVFPSRAEYDKAVTEKPESDTFKRNNSSSATYFVNVNCYVGESNEPVVYKRLHGESFNYVCDESTGVWNADSTYSVLPAQAAHYTSTVWYREKDLQNKASWADVNALLATESEINLYCYRTIEEIVLPAEPATWVYDDKKSYDIADLQQVLFAMGCKQTLTAEQLDALSFEIVYAKEDGKVSKTPSAIKESGVYSVSITLDPAYGSWQKATASTITVNVNTQGFNVVLVVFLVLGALAVAVTVSTAIIRKKVQTKQKKKQISQKEVLEKFRATGGETSLE